MHVHEQQCYVAICCAQLNNPHAEPGQATATAADPDVLRRMPSPPHLRGLCKGHLGGRGYPPLLPAPPRPLIAHPPPHWPCLPVLFLRLTCMLAALWRPLRRIFRPDLALCLASRAMAATTQWGLRHEQLIHSISASPGFPQGPSQTSQAKGVDIPSGNPLGANGHSRRGAHVRGRGVIAGGGTQFAPPPPGGPWR